MEVDADFTARTSDGVVLAGQQSAEDRHGREAPVVVVLLHGLTATRSYVVMGSRTLQRAGHRVIAYDARGHGHSTPAGDPRAYGYEHLTADLEAVMDELGVERALLAGASMGAHTAAAFALGHPERVRALALVTPAFDPDAEEHAPPGTPVGLAATAGGRGRDTLAAALRAGGVEGFLDAYDLSSVPEAWRETVERVLRQRLAAHDHPRAVADAIEAVSRSRPFEDLSELASITVPTVVIASRDEVDPGHPLALARRYVAAIGSASLQVEDGGPPVRSPIAWQGGRLSQVIAALAQRS